MKKSILFLFVIGLLVSCKKDKLPEPGTTGNPVFEFSGMVGSETVFIQGGVNDYYMYSSFAQDANGVKTYTGEFSKTGCSNCPNSLKITLIDYAPSNLVPTVSDSTFYAGNYNLATASGAASRYSVSFTKNTLGPINTGIDWNFGDGVSQLELNPVHTYVRPGKYNVSMLANFAGGCTSALGNEISLGNTGEFCEAVANISNPSATSFNFMGSALAGTPPYTYFWDFGDGNTTTDQNYLHTYAAEGVYTVSLRVRDANGLEDVSNQNIRTQNSNECVARYSYSVNAISNPDNLGNVLIEWRDASGKLYTSKNDSQPLRSNFKVNSVEEYKLNENNQKTKKLNIQFSCTLYNGADQIEIKNATATIAVAY